MSTFLRAADGRYFGPERLGDLDRKRSHAAGCTVDQNLLTRLDLAFGAKTLQGSDGRHWHGRCFLEGYVGRFQHQRVFRRTYVLGKTAPAARGYVPEDLITRLEARDALAHCFDLTGNIRAEDLSFRPQEPGAQADQERIGPQHVQVGGIRRCRMNLDQDFIVAGSGFGLLPGSEAHPVIRTLCIQSLSWVSSSVSMNWLQYV